MIKGLLDLWISFLLVFSACLEGQPLSWVTIGDKLQQITEDQRECFVLSDVKATVHLPGLGGGESLSRANFQAWEWPNFTGLAVLHLQPFLVCYKEDSFQVWNATPLK